MKIRNILTFALAGALALASCTKEVATDSFENIKLDKTFLSISTEGGSATVTINATESWKLNCPDSLYWKKSSTWVTPSDTVGAAGQTKLSLSAAAGEGRELNLTITCGANTQNLVVRQGELEATVVTCGDIIAGKVSQGKSVIVEGTCVSIYNTTYGNWYLNDGTGEITIYGTLNNGKSSAFASLGIEAGDKVKVQGPYTVYGSTHELVDVTVLKITKSLVKVESESATVEKDGGKFTVKVSYKGSNVQPSVPDEYQDWVSITGVEIHEGKATKIEPNPADTAYVAVKVAANEGGDREGELSFTSSTSKASYSFTQKGAIIDATIAEFLAAAESSTQYRVTGVVTAINASSKYHNAEITISDGTFTSSVLLHRAVVSDGNIEDKGIAVGDVVTVLGKRGSYNGTPQMAQGGVVESFTHYATLTIPEFLSKATTDKTVYAVTGEITKIANLTGKDSYNNVNITIKDSDNNELYLYRVTTFDKTDCKTLNPTVGSTITVAGTRGEYKGTAQMAQGGVVIAYTPKAE